MTKDARENGAALVDRARPDTGLDSLALPGTQPSHRQLAEWEVIEPGRDVDVVGACVALARGLGKRRRVLRGQRSGYPLAERRPAAAGALLQRERTKPAAPPQLGVKRIGVLPALKRS